MNTPCNQSMKTSAVAHMKANVSFLAWTIAIAFTLGSAAVASAQTTFNVEATADNVFAVYTGDVNGNNLTYWGGNTWTTSHFLLYPTVVNVTVPSNDYVYVAAWSDKSVDQGFLATFQSGAYTVNTGNPQWQVAATNYNLNPGDAVPGTPGTSPANIPGNLAPGTSIPYTPTQVGSLTQAIQTANSTFGSPTQEPSPWVVPAAYSLDNALGGPYNPSSVVPGIAGAAQWLWFNDGTYPASATDNLFTDGLDHGEYLIFRLPVTATPEPSSCVLFISGSIFAALAMLKRRRATGLCDAVRDAFSAAKLPALAWTALLVAFVILGPASPTVRASNPIIYQQLPDTSTAAIAVNATAPRILADDFPLTQTTQVTDLHVFGAFLNDTLPALGASDVTFSLSLHTDNGLSPSLPVNPPLFQLTTLPSAVSAPAAITEAFFDPVAGFVGSDSMVYEYDFNISPLTLGPGTYWLNVEAQPGPTAIGVNSIFGWATTAPASGLGDDAAWGSTPLGGFPTPWNSSAKGNVPFNLAFAVTGNLVPEPSTVCMAGMGLVALVAVAYRRRRIRN